MKIKRKLKWFYVVGAIFILLNSIALAMGFQWLALLPISFLILIVAIFRIDILILLLVFLVPLSIEFENVGIMGLGISLPDEPLLILLAATVIFKFIIDGNYDYSVFKHPISIAILINTAWIFMDCFLSEHKIISFKYFFSRCWFIIVFYFLAIVLFKKIRNIHNFHWLYIAGLTIVIIYTFIQHSQYNFSQIVSFTIMQPFFVGHGVYAAAIAFFIPYLLMQALYAYKLRIPASIMIISAALLTLFSLAIVFSYARAAWVSLAAAAALMILFALRVRFFLIIAVLSAVSFYVVSNSDDIIYRLSFNKQNSAEGLEKHLESVSNIQNDVSNLERVNRWVAAINMSKVKPITGFGPGTYPFDYAVYQDPQYKTEITTYFGDNGGVHSEYLAPLAETGWIGLLSFLLILFFVYKTGFQLIYKSKKYSVQILATSILLGLSTYLTHGLLNNYSETDKIAVIFWGSFAMITALDMFHKEESLMNSEEK